MRHFRSEDSSIPDHATEVLIENRSFDDLPIGTCESVTHRVTQRDIDLFAAATGGIAPHPGSLSVAPTDPPTARGIPGIWAGGLIAALIATRLPGPGSRQLGQTLRFPLPIAIGDTIRVRVTVLEKHADAAALTLECHCTNQRGDIVVTGTAEVVAARDRHGMRFDPSPVIRIERHDRMQALRARAAAGAAIFTAVVYPVDAAALSAAVEAAAAGLIVPVLIGPSAQIRTVATAQQIDITGLRLVDLPDAEQAAAQAVKLARTGEVGMLMKGDLHTDVLMHPVVASATGLRTARHISHAYLLDVPDYPRFLLLTDMAINIAPTLEEKVGIVQNAIDCARVIGIVRPRVAILAAVETVNPRMVSTLDAAALCKMADRGQITGGVLDGPLAFDNAIDLAAAAEKGIVSPVAGQADILVVPDLEAGNMLAKEFTFLAGAEAAGVVLGATVPIVLTSRSDSEATRIASCALGVLLARADPNRGRVG